MNPAEMQAAAAAVMARLQGGGQGGGQRSLGTPTSRVAPPPIQEDEPGWNPATMGNKLGMVQPPTGGMMPNNLDAILRRIEGGGAGSIPGGDTTARPVPGDHIGLSELAQGSLLDQNMPPNAQGVMGPSSGPLLDIVRMLTQGTNRGRIEEDSPLFNPATMGNRIGRR